VNHPAAASKPLDIAHGEDRLAGQVGQYLIQPIALRAADKQHLAVSNLLDAAIALHDQRSTIAVSPRRSHPNRLERVLAQHPITRGAVACAKVFVGHSTNWVKLNRKPP